MNIVSTLTRCSDVAVAVVPAVLPKGDRGGGYRVRGLRSVTWGGVMEEIFEARCNSDI